MVKSLKISGIKFVMHVIGFDVTDKEKAQLSCLAEAGGGSYSTVKNQEEAGNPTMGFAGIKIEAGRTVEKVAEF